MPLDLDVQEEKNLILAAMYSPDDKNKEDKIGWSLMKQDICTVLDEQLEAGAKAFTILPPMYAALKNGTDLSFYKKDITKAQNDGWLACIAYMYLFRAKVFGDTFSEIDTELDTLNRCEYFVHNFASNKTENPFRHGKPDSGKGTIKRAIKRMWPVAHYWAALCYFEGKKYNALKYDNDFFEFANLAEKFRIFGLEYNIFAAMGGDKYDEEQIAFHPNHEIKYEFNITVSQFTEDEMKFMSEYTKQ